MTRPCAICGGPILSVAPRKTRCHMCSTADRAAKAAVRHAETTSLGDQPRGCLFPARPTEARRAIASPLDIERAIRANLVRIRATHQFTLRVEDIYAQRGCGGASPPDDYAGITEAFRGARARSAGARHRLVQARRRERAERAAEGKCLRCAQPTTEHHVYCEQCRFKEAERGRARRAAAKVAA